MASRGLRNGAIASFVVAMAIILTGGYYAMDRVPPIPSGVKANVDDEYLTGHDEILRGQAVFQRYGLMDHGSIWGHGTYRGMDFSADTLHRLGEAVRDYHAGGASTQPGDFAKLPHALKEDIEARAAEEMRKNGYETSAHTLYLTPAQVYAFKQNRGYWEKQFAGGNPRYGFLPNTVPTAAERQDLADFFFWTAWAAGTDRPGETFSYTNNWPPDRSVGNTPPVGAILWSIGGILSLFIVLGIVIYIVHCYRFVHGPARAVEAAYRIMEVELTPSQRASAKFFLVAGLLFLAQIMNGGLLAHYTVHPGSFYIQWIAQFYPYSWAKTWHLQLGILWIATAWVGTAIYVAPLIAGREPKGQRLLVNILFAAMCVVIFGSLFGEALGIKGVIGSAASFWVGHQGWEYLELGRLWQILLFGGLIFWLVIVYRALGPALKRTEIEAERRSLIAFYTFSAIAVVAFFGFGLLYGRGTHLTIADYWRWFVVHIWVESIFEFFGVAVIALFLVTLGLVTAASALRVAYLTAIITFFSGIAGTAHHYFWFGGPSFWLGVGAVFSSLEPIPLVLLVVRGWMEFRSIREQGAEFPYKWPLYFLVASSFWNFLGAGVFGFTINLPIINYYEHGSYLTANHGHAALFGTYGMLAIALILFSWRGLVERKHWNDRILKLSFWALNGGLFLMTITTLLPVGLLQTYHNFVEGVWYGRSADFYELPFVQAVGNWRIVPDSIIILFGALPLLWFLVTTFPLLRKGAEKTGKPV